MSAAYLFMFAAVIAALSILTVYRIFIGKVKQHPDDRPKLLSQFMIRVAISETLPLILLVLAFMNIETVTNINELYLPGLVVLITMAFVPFFIFLQTKVDVTEETKSAVKHSSYLAIGLAMAIPISSFVGLITLMPK